MIDKKYKENRLQINNHEIIPYIKNRIKEQMKNNDLF